MAGDWMKIELELPDKPEVHSIAGTLNLDPDCVVGKLVRVWQWFDKHTVDGNAFGVTYSLLDRITGVTGFGEAMMFVGWMEQNDKTLTMPKFDRHTSASAKQRALTAKRVEKTRTKNVTVEALPREEKRREESNTYCASPDGDCTDEAKNPLYTKAFLMFWEIYPLRKNKGDAAKAFSKIKAAEYPAIKAGLVAAKESSGWLKDNGQYIPHPGTWLRARGWEDEQVVTVTKPDGKLDVVAWMNSKEARNG